MNILNFLSFDIGEFLTSTEGILIIAGIICLIIGIVCLCMGNGKGKKDSAPAQNQTSDDSVPNNDQTTTPVSTENVSSVSTVEDNTNVDSVPSSVVSDKVVEPVVFSSTSENNSSVTNETAPAAPSAPVVEKLDVTQSIPNVTPEVLTSSSNVEQPVESLSSPNPVPETLDTPTVVSQSRLEDESSNISPVSNTSTVLPEPTPVAPSVPTQSSAYGGASLDVPNGEALFEKPREIYGGANPLENTAPIPTEKVTTAYHSSVTPVETLSMPTSNGNGTVSQYQNSTPAVTPVTPVVNPQPTVSVTPVVNVTPVAPVTPMSSNTPVTPVVNPTPSVTPSVPVTPAMPSTSSVTPMAPKEEIEKLEF